MKKSYFLTGVLIFLTTVAFAQTKSGTSPLLKQSFKTQQERGKKTSLRFVDMNSAKAHSAKKAKAAATDEIITVTPAGESKIYERKGYSYYYNYYKVYLSEVTGYVSEMVFADDGKTVYWKNPIGEYPTQSWLKGEKTSDNKIKFSLPQPILLYESSYGSTTYYATRLVQNSAGDSYVPDETTADVEFAINEDGSIVQDGPDDSSYILGMTNADGGWSGYGDYGTKLLTVTDIPNTPPDNLKFSDYSIKYLDEVGYAQSGLAKGAISGNDIYLTNLPYQAEGSYMKGTISDGKAIFKDKQYLGVDAKYNIHSYMLTVNIVEKEDPYTGGTYNDFEPAGTDLVFNYDKENGILTSDNHFVFNLGADRIYYLKYFGLPELQLIKRVSATPKNPVFTDYYPYNDYYEFGYATFDIEPKDTEGNDLNTSNLYYNVFFDDEKYTFTPEIYTKITEDLTDVPYDFSDNLDIYIKGTSRTIHLYKDEKEYKKFGVQLVYISEGETHKSEIVYSDGSSTTDINNITVNGKTDGRVISTSYTDISGRRTNNPTKGLYIKSEKLEDGTVRTSKVILK